MAFAYSVMTEQEAMQERFQLLKPGIYEAVISKSVDTVSQNSGNPMMDITVTVYDENGKPHDVRDFLVFTIKMMWKVIHCADAAGLLKEFEDGKFCSELLQGASVQVQITIEEGGIIPEDKLKGKVFGSKYSDKNKIEDYIKRGDQKPLPGNSGEIEDSEIPF